MTPAAQIKRLREALTKALWHVEELRDAWQRGSINECDSKSGTRSNRNVEVELAIRSALADVPAEAPKYAGAPQLGQPWQDRLRALKHDWDSYCSVPISDAAIKTVEGFSVVPCSHGGLQVVSYRDGWEVEIEIEADGTISDAEAKRTAAEPVETRKEWRVAWEDGAWCKWPSEAEAREHSTRRPGAWIESRTITTTPWKREKS